MSSVSGSDNSTRQKDDVRRTREDSRANESELMKRHQKEIRRLTEQHANEIEEIKKAHAQQMDDLKKSSQETISSRDHKYAQDVESLRNLHRKQIFDTASEAARNMELTRNTAEKEIEQSKMRHDQHYSELSNDYATARAKQEEETSQAFTEMREKNQKSVQDYRENINKRHANELEEISKTRQREQATADTQNRNYRKASEARFRDQELRHFQDRQKNSDDLIDTVRQERTNQQQNEAILRQGFGDSLDRTRQKYENRSISDREKTAQAFDKTKDEVYERVNNQVRRLERQNKDLKNSNIQEDLARKAETDRTVRNMRDAFTQNVEVAQRERDEILHSSNEDNAKNLQKLHKVKSDEEVERTREFLKKYDSQETRAKDNLDTVENEYHARTEGTKKFADQRIKHIINDTDDQKARLTEFHEENRKALTMTHQDDIQDMRARVDKEKRDAIATMKEQMRKQEIQHQDRMAAQSVKFESEITRMKDELNKLRKAQDEQLKRQAGELQRAHQAELEAQQVQFRDKLSKTENHHTDEIKQVNRKNQERVDQLISTLKKA